MDEYISDEYWKSNSGVQFIDKTRLRYPSYVASNSFPFVHKASKMSGNVVCIPSFETRNISIEDINSIESNGRLRVDHRCGSKVYHNYSEHREKIGLPKMMDIALPLPVTLDPDLPASIVEKIKNSKCEICNVKMTSYIHCKSHYEGKPHAKKVKLAKRELDPILSEELLHSKKKTKTKVIKGGIANLYCKCCNLCFTSQSHATQHYMGRNHQRVLHGLKPLEVGYYNAHTAKWQREPIDPKVAAELIKPDDDSFKGAGKFLCEICSVVTTCQEQLDKHLNGKVHAKKIKVQQFASMERIDCSLCGLRNMEEHQYLVHINGKNHTKRLKRAKIAELDERLSCIGHDDDDDENPSEEFGEVSSNIKSLRSSFDRLNNLQPPPPSSSPSLKLNEDSSNTIGSFVNDLVTDVAAAKFEDYTIFKTPLGNFHCGSCQATLPSEHRLAAHLATRGHKQKEQAFL